MATSKGGEQARAVGQDVQVRIQDYRLRRYLTEKALRERAKELGIRLPSSDGQWTREGE